ncbi:MAG TPA: isoprenoid biosynthesis glyoxalase ElbB [Polyangiaceae bacterium]|jgi:enhancing lycopene biosynthesis protein 2|nr:MAG: Enhancing lycopene biosynthesis protein 2 [Deltaproteobacteria bacterium ADurb.Bin207]HNZ25175.1 isoprenoid biosynthesis glyoxalase ElbB [Polyangiaceae bacterium]HOD25193.1 isoprenoid biosynthesis glyoxalase ElbB [Polyangiaceae bacterium]HOE50623.1 isoprenoid biosynthesis glyoxalase ElbB [Polyangiaceae bacterium]HOH03278.1 isoprenoid biosynthesis glyoxalase ElbB [Polyangiaceae bacterium]
MGKRVAVVLSGCGYLDGAEIYESVSVLLALDLEGAQVQCFAPDKAQMHVVHHGTQTPVQGETRNVLTEASRLARGQIKAIEEARMEDFDALVFPGGYGVAKNLCDYAVKGSDCTVDPRVDALIKAAHGAKKPICAICIAPVLIAKSLGLAHHPTLTIGSDAGTAADIEKMGGKHVNAPVTEIVVDEQNRVVTTPAYMCGQRIGDVWLGVKKAVEKTLSMA